MSSTLRDLRQFLEQKISGKKQDLLLQFVVLTLIYILAFAVRLFSVLRYESVIHEFDPYFNFRSTKFLVNEGFYNFLNWFDEASWYPLGRIVGGTIYPGLMVSAAAVYWVLNFFNITINIRNVCVLLAPWFASNTALVAYFFGKEVSDSRTGLIAAAFLAIVPGYISRSVAGSFDNEGIAIFTMLLTYFLWIKSVNTGSLYWSAACALAYFYMVSAWGGYVFIINLIPFHVLVLLITGRYSTRIYVAYNTFYVVGTLLAMQITFVGFQPVQSSEHMAAFGIFGLLQIYAGVVWIRGMLTEENFNKFVGFTIIGASGALLFVAVVGTLTGYISPFTGRFYSLLDPTYAKKHIPIIASVSEHQPTSWSSFFFDLHFLVFMFPVGLYYCFKDLTDVNIFVILYGITSVYFTGVMVRLMLILAPIMCITSAFGVSSVLKNYMRVLNPPPKVAVAPKSKPSAEVTYKFQTEVATLIVLILTVFMVYYVFHCVWVTSEAYSSPSIVLSARGDHGNVIFDDFRESYYWLRHNTAPDARIMSWWDYGYQISAMANRTVLVDNNTWNNSHIAQVGKAFSSSEDVAYEIMQQMDVDYVLVIFGGVIGYSQDDINKFLWMVRIAGSTDPNIREPDYYTPEGEFRIDARGSPVLLNCLMYKCCYHNFAQMYTEGGKPPGWDRVRHAEIGNKDFQLQHIEEAFTSEHWLVRIYRVLPPSNRA